AARSGVRRRRPPADCRVTPQLTQRRSAAQVHAVAALAGATVLGLLFQRLRVPGGLLVGALVGSAAVTVALDVQPEAPTWLALAAPLGIGVMVGVMFNREVVSSLKPMVLPAGAAALG